MALERERSSASFSVEHMQHILYGMQHVIDKRRIAEVLLQDPKLKHWRDSEPFISKGERIRQGMEKTLHFFELVHKHNLEELGLFRVFSVDYAFPPLDNMPHVFSDGMFLQVLTTQMTQEQAAKWLPFVRSRCILGCYAQTEMGHGSNVRGLETTATYDPESKEWVINSPTLSSTKWWPGGLGLSANFAAVYARAISNGVDHGVFPFLVQLRSLETHLPLPGITLGSSGPTMGYYANEHGRCCFDHVRIPKDNLMQKWVKISDDGKFAQVHKETRASYFAMVLTRASFVGSAATQLGKAVTIAIRYSAIRQQGSPGPGLPEMHVLDYQMQQLQLFSALAADYALHFTARYVRKLSDGVRQGLEGSGSDTSGLKELHATVSGLKALATWIMGDNIEICRRCCGGYGYSLYSGMPQIYVNCCRMMSTEGDNTVLCLQTARYLTNAWTEARKGKLHSGVLAYFNTGSRARCTVGSPGELLEPAIQLEAFAHWAARLASKAAKHIEDTAADQNAKNEYMVELVNLSKAHCYYTVLFLFAAAIQEVEQPDLKTVLKTLCDLFALSTMEQNLGGFVVDSYLSEEQAEWVSQTVRSLLQAVRPNAVALVDAFNYHDELELHQTALGATDGRVYERLYEWSEKDPVNQRDVVEGVHFLKDFMRLKGTVAQSAPHHPPVWLGPAARSRF